VNWCWWNCSPPLLWFFDALKVVDLLFYVHSVTNNWNSAEIFKKHFLTRFSSCPIVRRAWSMRWLCCCYSSTDSKCDAQVNSSQCCDINNTEVSVFPQTRRICIQVQHHVLHRCHMCFTFCVIRNLVTKIGLTALFSVVLCLCQLLCCLVCSAHSWCTHLPTSGCVYISHRSLSGILVELCRKLLIT